MRNGSLKINSDKPVVIMISGNFCGYCKAFKPEFQNFADMVNGNDVYAATIVIDEQQKLGDQIKNFVPNFMPHPARSNRATPAQPVRRHGGPAGGRGR